MSIENTLTELEVNNLTFMREEEKLAHDVYLYLYEMWGINIFNNIARAEQTHMDSVKVILDTYNIDDPVISEQGSFLVPDLQTLYDGLIEQGSASLVDALSVGVLIEEVDIQDLYQAINETSNPDIIEMYTNLLNGSYKHLNAFVSQLSSQGVTYEPQILTTEIFDAILNGEDIAIPETSLPSTGFTFDERTISELFQATFARELSSESALSGWVDRLEAKKDNGLTEDLAQQSILSEMGLSSESLAIYGHLTDEETVDFIFNNSLGRNANEPGRTLWIERAGDVPLEILQQQILAAARTNEDFVYMDSLIEQAELSLSIVGVDTEIAIF